MDIINPSQTGSLHGQYIGDNIRQVLETIEHYENNQGNQVWYSWLTLKMIMYGWECIYKCLEYLHFVESLIRWVKVM